MIYIYITSLLLTIILIFSALVKCAECPPKICILSSAVLVLLILRYISLFIMYMSKNINYIYMLKPFYFIYFLCIPLCGLISVYILIRNDKINFMYILLISFVIIIVYEIVMLKMQIYISISDDYGFGYVMYLTKYSIYMDVFNLAVNIVFLLTAISFLNKKNIVGMFFIMLAALTSIIGMVFMYIGKYNVPQYILGELFWIMALNYSLEKVRKKKAKQDFHS